MRDSMVFYRSYLEAVTDLPPKEFKACVLAILQYAMDGTIPSGCGIEKTVLAMAKPQIDKNNQKYINGLKGGRPSNQTETDLKPNENLTETKQKPNQTEIKPNKTKSEKSKPNVYDNVNDLVVNKNNNNTIHACARACACVSVEEFEQALECEGWEHYPNGEVYAELRDALIYLINEGSLTLGDISHKCLGALLNSMFDGRERRQITNLQAYCLVAVQNYKKREGLTGE